MKPFGCCGCNKRFMTAAAAEQHARDKGHEEYESEEELPPLPFEDAEGEWVYTDEFTGRKSFGAYYCHCDAWWISAHAFPKFRQGCKSCGRYVLPRFMWVNEAWRNPLERREERDGPHMRALCEACRAGVCTGK